MRPQPHMRHRVRVCVRVPHIWTPNMVQENWSMAINDTTIMHGSA